MSKFCRLSDSVRASSQLTLDDLKDACAEGFRLIINNRPDGEEPAQPSGTEIEAAARLLGMDYIAIPVSHSGINGSQVHEMVNALADADGPILAYCRSGKRSTLLWSLAQAAIGHDPKQLATIAAKAGFDVGAIRPAMEMFAAGFDA